jgi:TRAP-type C4-dicarboxylate transport system permease small subunit
MDGLYRGWRFLQDRVIGYMAALMLLGATILACVEIFRRYIEGSTFHWGQDAVTYFLVSAAFLYFGASQAQRAHLAVTLLPDFLLRRGRAQLAHMVRAIASLLGVMFVIAFVYWGLPTAQRAMDIGRMTESMIIPLWPFMYVLLIGMGAMGVTLLFQFYRDVMRILGHEVFVWDPDDEEFKL